MPTPGHRLAACAPALAGRPRDPHPSAAQPGRAPAPRYLQAVSSAPAKGAHDFLHPPGLPHQDRGLHQTFHLSRDPRDPLTRAPRWAPGQPGLPAPAIPPRGTLPTRGLTSSAIAPTAWWAAPKTAPAPAASLRRRRLRSSSAALGGAGRPFPGRLRMLAGETGGGGGGFYCGTGGGEGARTKMLRSCAWVDCHEALLCVDSCHSFWNPLAKGGLSLDSGPSSVEECLPAWMRPWVSSPALQTTTTTTNTHQVSVCILD